MAAMHDEKLWDESSHPRLIMVAIQSKIASTKVSIYAIYIAPVDPVDEAPDGPPPLPWFCENAHTYLRATILSYCVRCSVKKLYSMFQVHIVHGCK